LGILSSVYNTEYINVSLVLECYLFEYYIVLQEAVLYIYRDLCSSDFNNFVPNIKPHSDFMEQNLTLSLFCQSINYS